jgi:uncharacterized membrane protein YkvA (DUF1232 family)
VNWTVSAVGLSIIALLAPLVDRQLLETLRVQGFAAFRVAVVFGRAVYVRLLVDGRAPRIGKVLLLFAVLYGVAPHDLLPERIGVIGLLDDVVFVALAARVFTRLCPDLLVEEHAIKAAQGWARAMRHRLPSTVMPGSPS